jgi:hypothetical protein
VGLEERGQGFAEMPGAAWQWDQMPGSASGNESHKTETELSS